jgi:hypothetical protein
MRWLLFLWCHNSRMRVERDGKKRPEGARGECIIRAPTPPGEFCGCGALSRGIAEIMCARLQIKVAKRAIKRHHVQVAGAGVCVRKREADMRCALLLSYELTQLNYLS